MPTASDIQREKDLATKKEQAEKELLRQQKEMLRKEVEDLDKQIRSLQERRTSVMSQYSRM